jgi:hypothetical protein
LGTAHGSVENELDQQPFTACICSLRPHLLLLKDTITKNFEPAPKVAKVWAKIALAKFVKAPNQAS